jgi:hypothetical protein
MGRIWPEASQHWHGPRPKQACADSCTRCGVGVHSCGHRAPGSCSGVVTIGISMMRHGEVGWLGTGGEGGGARQGNVRRGSPGWRHDVKAMFQQGWWCPRLAVRSYISSRGRRGVRHRVIEETVAGGLCSPERANGGGVERNPDE